MVEDPGGDLRDHGVLVVALRQRSSSGRAQPVEVEGIDVADRHLLGEHDDAHHHRDGDQAEQQERGGRVAALGLAECGHAVADRLDAGQRSTPRGEGPCQQEHQPDLRQRPVPPLGGHDLQLRALGHGQVAGEEPQQAVGAHAQDRGHEEVGRDGEEGPGLAHTAQVHRGEQHHGNHTHRRLVPDQPVDGTGGILRCRGDRHCHGQDVVDQQRAGDGHAGVATQVDRGDLVVATAGGVGMHGLAIARHDGEHHQRDGDADLPRPDIGRCAGDGQHDEDLVRCVGHRRQRVAGEDREGDALGQQGLPQLAAPQLATQEDSLGDIADTHRREA